MTAFAACLFALAGLASAWTMLATVRRFGAAAAMLRTQLAACPDTMTVEWKMIERVAVPALGALRKRPARRAAMQPGLDWPQLERAA